MHKLLDVWPSISNRVNVSLWKLFDKESRLDMCKVYNLGAQSHVSVDNSKPDGIPMKTIR